MSTHVRKLLLVLLLGVLSTYVLSSACVILAHVLPTPTSMVLTPAVAVRLRPHLRFGESPVICTVTVERLRLRGVEQVTLVSTPKAKFAGLMESRAEVLAVTDEYEAADLATAILDGTIDHAVAAQQLIWTRSGWPWLALESRAQCDATKTDKYARVTWGIPLPIKPGTAGIPVLPLRPVWAGFVVSVSMWMAVWSIPIVLIPSLREYLNFIRKQCWRCGYDTRNITSALCPECGTNTRDARGPMLALLAARCRPLWRPHVRLALSIVFGIICTLIYSVLSVQRLDQVWPPWPSGYVGLPPTATVYDPDFADNPVLVYGCECRVPGARRVRLAINYNAAPMTKATQAVVFIGDPDMPLGSIIRGRSCEDVVRALEHGDLSLQQVAGYVEWYETGWPFLGLGFQANPVPSPTLLTQPIYGGVRIKLPGVLAVPLILPLTPIWSGLFGNVLVWSAVPLVLVFGVPWLIRKTRGTTL